MVAPIRSGSGSRPNLPELEPSKVVPEENDRWNAVQRAGYIDPDSATKPLAHVPSFDAALLRSQSSTDRGRRTASRSRDFLDRAIDGLADTAVRAATSFVSSQLERSTGLSVERLLDFDRYLLESLRISHGQPSKLLAALTSDKAPLIYVQIGTKQGENAVVEDAIERNLRKVVEGNYGKSRETPPTEVPAKYHPIWNRLIERLDAQEPLVEVSLGPDPRVRTALDLMAYETIVGAGEYGPAMRKAIDREAGYWVWSDPWYQENRPQVHQRIETVKGFVSPPWLAGRTKEPFGYNIGESSAKSAYRALMGPLMSPEGKVDLKSASARDIEDFLDIVASLHQDTLTGVQSYWVKLLRELPASERRSVLTTLTHATSLSLFTGGLDVVGPDGYLRSEHVIDILREALNGLGHSDRSFLSWMILRNLKSHSADIEIREALAKKICPAYPGAELSALAKMPRLQDALADLSTQQTLRIAADSLAANRPKKMELQQDFRRHEATLRLLNEIAMRPSQLDFEGFTAENLPTQPVIVGEYYGPHLGRRTIRPEMLNDKKPAEMPPKLGVSVVLEGGGGKGFAYPEMLARLSTALEAVSGAKIDEYAGTSAGAITAGLLAAGYTSQDLKSLLPKLSFTKFYSDFFALDGGVDGKVRGIDRNGLFSTRMMYETIHDLLAKKLGIEGRPVFFSDLPSGLKVMSMVVGGDLPRVDQAKLGIGPDGMIEFSQAKTPNMDVAAAIVASAAVPVFFHSPQLHVCLPKQDDDGTTRFRQFRLQLADGGALNNLPEDRATKDPKAKDALVVIPTYIATPIKNGPALETLDFAPQGLDQIDAYNAQRFSEWSGGLTKLLENASDSGYGRATIAFNLTTPAEQKYPVVQGESGQTSAELQDLAKLSGLRVLKGSEGKKVIDRSSNKSQGLKDLLAEGVFETLLENKDDVLQPSFGFGRRVYTPPRRELRGMWDVVRSVAAGILTGRQYDSERRFDRT
ncbi:MAG: patatin-like phospholipase family protein [Deltaproteobacteria bacterium]|nr:patatin-like phospholipase family protein [Deltaproteobacteria bacterium]